MKYVASFVVGLAACAPLASAASVTLQFTGSGFNRSISIVDTSLGRSGTFATGQLLWRVTASTFPYATVNSNILTYCTDISQYVGNGPLEIVPLASAPDPNGPMGPDRAALLAKLYAARYNTANTSNDDAAAFQLAVWEIVNEANFVAGNSRGSSNLDIFAGDFRATNNNTVRNRANAFIDAAFAESGAGLGLVAGVSPTLQDQVFIVPLPAAAGLAAFGLLALASTRRRLH